MKLLAGLLRLALFQKDGFDAFAPTRQGFLNSLPPLLAFPVVGTLFGLIQGNAVQGISGLLATLVALLAPAVVSHFLALRWGREAAWLRYAVAFNWCQWAVPVMAVPLLMVAGVIVRGGVSMPVAAIGFLVVLLIYAIGLHFFLARSGLGVSRGRAVLMVLATNFATLVLVVLPRLFLGGTE